MDNNEQIIKNGLYTPHKENFQERLRLLKNIYGIQIIQYNNQVQALENEIEALKAQRDIIRAERKKLKKLLGNKKLGSATGANKIVSNEEIGDTIRQADPLFHTTQQYIKEKNYINIAVNAPEEYFLISTYFKYGTQGFIGGDKVLVQEQVFASFEEEKNTVELRRVNQEILNKRIEQANILIKAFVLIDKLREEFTGQELVYDIGDAKSKTVITLKGDQFAKILSPIRVGGNGYAIWTGLFIDKSNPLVSHTVASYLYENIGFEKDSIALEESGFNFSEEDFKRNALGTQERIEQYDLLKSGSVTRTYFQKDQEGNLTLSSNTIGYQSLPFYMGGDAVRKDENGKWVQVQSKLGKSSVSKDTVIHALMTLSLIFSNGSSIDVDALTNFFTYASINKVVSNIYSNAHLEAQKEAREYMKQNFGSGIIKIT